MDTAQLRNVFDRVPLLAAMAEPDRDRLWLRARIRTGRAGELLVSQGAGTDTLHLLLVGTATSISVTTRGRSVSLARWQAPVVVDKVTMFTAARQPASVAVDSATATWCTVPFAAVRSILDASPAAQRHVLAALAAAASQARESFVDVATRPTTARLARWLVVALATGAPIRIPRPQERLALQLGTTRVTLNRALHRLAVDGVIHLRGSAVTVTDTDELRRRADL